MRDYIVTTFILAILPVCLMRPWLGIIAWYWFGLMNPHRLTWSFAYSMPFAMMIGGATLLGLLFAKDRRPIPWNTPLMLTVVLTAYFTMTTFFAWAPEYAWPQWEKVVKIIFMTLIATMLIYGYQRIRVLMLTIVVSIGWYGVHGAIRAIMRGGAGRVEGPDGSFISGNTFIGLALNMVIPLMIILAREEKQPWVRRALYAAAALGVLAVIFTYSRGAYVGLIVMLPLLFLSANRKIIAAAILIPAVLLAPVVLPERVFQRADLIQNYGEEGSANQRILAWSVAFNIARESPLTGAGFLFEVAGDDAKWQSYGWEEYRSFTRAAHSAHSIYFQVLGDHGFVAFFLWITLVVSVLLSFSRTRRLALETPGCEWVATYATALRVALAAYLVSGAFLSSAYFDLAWLYFALTAVLARELKLARSASPLAKSAGPAAAVSPGPRGPASRPA